MKKIIAVLMILVTMSVASCVAAFAETVILMDTGTELAFTDTTSIETQKLIEKEVSGLTDWEILCKLNEIFCNIYKSKGHTVTFEHYEISPADIVTEKYGMYQILDYNGEWIAPVVSLGGGRKITIMYSIEK